MQQQDSQFCDISHIKMKNVWTLIREQQMNSSLRCFCNQQQYKKNYLYGIVPLQSWSTQHIHKFLH